MMNSWSTYLVLRWFPRNRFSEKKEFSIVEDIKQKWKNGTPFQIMIRYICK